MDSRQLAYFSAVAARMSFRRAADDVHITQPALSQQVRRLENELGVELFDRRRHPIRLTSAGAHLLVLAHQILDAMDNAVAEVREFGSEYRGRIVLGAMQYLTSLEVPDLLAAFRTRHPRVELQLRMGNTGQLETMLRADEIDLALCHSDGLDLPPGFAIEPLRDEELVLIVAPSHPLAGRDQVSVTELADAPFITFRHGASIHDALMNAFAEHGLVPQVGFESADMATAFALVGRGLGVALVPRSITSHGASPGHPVHAVPVGPGRISRTVALIWRRDRYHSPTFEAFSEYTRRYLATPPRTGRGRSAGYESLRLSPGVAGGH